MTEETQDELIRTVTHVQPSDTEPALRVQRYSADSTGNLVEYVDEDGAILNAVDNQGDANGGSQPGAGITTVYTVAFDAAGLSSGAGVELFTPKIGDELIDVTVRATTPFDGTTPYVDLGSAVGTNLGIYGVLAGSGNQIIVGTISDYVEQGGFGWQKTSEPNTLAAYIAYQVQNGGRPKFTTPDPVKVWVTQNGAIDGDDPVNTAGVLEVAVTISTPVAVP